MIGILLDKTENFWPSIQTTNISKSIIEQRLCRIKILTTCTLNFSELKVWALKLTCTENGTEFLSFQFLNKKKILNCETFFWYEAKGHAQIAIKRWVMVGVVGNTSLLACWYWHKSGPRLKFQQLKYSWPTVGPTTTHK